MATESKLSTFGVGVCVAVTAAAIVAAAAKFSGDWDALESVILSMQTAAAALFALIAGLGLYAAISIHRHNRGRYSWRVLGAHLFCLALVSAGAQGVIQAYEDDPPPGHDRLFE